VAEAPPRVLEYGDADDTVWRELHVGSSASDVSVARFVKSTGTEGRVEHADSKNDPLGVSMLRTDPGAVTDAPKREYDGFTSDDTVRVAYDNTQPVTVEATPTLSSVVEGDYIAADDHGKARKYDSTVSDDTVTARAVDSEFDQAGQTYLRVMLLTYRKGDA
jgi:hypothetical protein